MIGSEMIRRRVRVVVNRFVGSEQRVVRVRTGTARGARLALDLSREKAFWLGYYERPLQGFFRENVTPGDIVYDVGAHIGFMSVCAARLGAVVYAFEPVPENAARLRGNASLNELEIHVVEVAVWAEPGAVELVSGGSDFEHRATPGHGTPCISLDEFAERGRLPAVIKLDVEGAEAEVLRGARRLLAEVHPLLVCELHGPGMRDTVEELLGDYAIEELDSPTHIVARPLVAR